MVSKQKTALITGISGQDGSYLASLLLSNGYRVIGLTRKRNSSLERNLTYLNILDRVEVVEADLSQYRACENVLIQNRPDEVYNLAAQSSVSISFQKPLETINFNVTSLVNLLEAIRKVDPGIRFYQASSSEMFGSVNQLPITINSTLHPVSPYGISKATGHWLVSQYRESYQLFAVSGVLFNHESYLRPETFFVKKVIANAVRIAQGRLDNLTVGSIDIKRDFGSASDYVKAIWLMMCTDTPKDYLVCSGTSVSLRDILYYVFKILGLENDRIIEDPALKRPSEINDIYGDPTPIQTDLGWRSKGSFFQVIDEMIEAEIKNTTST